MRHYNPMPGLIPRHTPGNIQHQHDVGILSRQGHNLGAGNCRWHIIFNRYGQRSGRALHCVACCHPNIKAEDIFLAIQWMINGLAQGCCVISGIVDNDANNLVAACCSDQRLGSRTTPSDRLTIRG